LETGKYYHSREKCADRDMLISLLNSSADVTTVATPTVYGLAPG